MSDLNVSSLRFNPLLFDSTLNAHSNAGILNWRRARHLWRIKACDVARDVIQKKKKKVKNLKKKIKEKKKKKQR